MAGHYRLVLLAYPRSYRRAHGDELAETAGLLGGGRWSFRQARSLVVGGLRTRSRLDTGGLADVALARGVAVGLTFHLLLVVAPAVTSAIRSGGLRQTDYWLGLGMYLLPVVVLLLGAGRTMVMATTVVAVVLLTQLRGVHQLFELYPLVPRFTLTALFHVSWAATMVALWWLAFRHGRLRPMSTRTVAGIIVATAPLGLLDYPVGGLVVDGLVLVALPVGGLLLLTVDPRATVAAATVCALRLSNEVAVLALPIGLASASDVPMMVVLAAWGALVMAGGLLAVRRLAAEPGPSSESELGTGAPTPG